MPKKKATQSLGLPFLVKILILGGIITFAAWISQTHYPRTIIEALLPYWMLAAIFVGILYTSFLTIPFAIIGLYILSEHIDLIPLVLLAGFGSTIGDLIIVKILRQLFSSISLAMHIKEKTNWFIMTKKLLKAWHLNTFAVVIGALIVASPFPDEVGLALLGLSGISYTKLMCLVFCLNVVGVLLIVAPAYLFF